MLLLDLPDALLVHCLAGAGGKGVSRAAAACRRLSRLSLSLQQQPLFASAFSDDKKLEGAITDAAMRAMTGTWGAVDFALLFVANYPRPKKFSDPSDAAHAATLLQGVLGKDIPIVGCCCSGVMGVGRDSRPAEVDPATSRAMPASLVRRLGPDAPRRGVSLLLGRLPPGWVARTLAPANLPTDLPEPAAAPDWPEFSDALALTASQAAQLAADIQAAAGLAGDGGGSGGGSSGTAVLQPEAALLLYQSDYQGTEDLDVTVAWLQAHAPAMQIVGGASSGKTGDLLISPGAAHRLGTEAPPAPPLVGLLLCSAQTGDSSRPRAGAAAAQAAAGAAAAAGSSAAGSSRGALPPAAPAACSSAGSLRVASMSVQGVGPAPGSSIFAVGGVSFGPIQYNQRPPIVFIMSIESATILAPGGSSAAAAAAAEEEQPAVRRSERTATAGGASAVAPAVNGLVAMMHQLAEAGEFDTPMVAVWRCPPGAMPAAFTGEEEAALVLSVADPGDSMFDGSTLQLTLYELCRHPEGSTEAALEALVADGAPGSLLCMQFVQFAGDASARAIARGFKTLQQQLQAPPPAGPVSAAVCRHLPGSAEDCYAALARTAAAAGARSSRHATAIFSCTGRGVSLFRPVEGAAADAPCEAALVDAAWQQQAAFVGCYVNGELGPPVRHACLGFGGSSQQQAYTSMFAVLSSA